MIDLNTYTSPKFSVLIKIKTIRITSVKTKITIALEIIRIAATGRLIGES